MSVRGAPFAYHGGRVAEAARLFPDAPRPWLDLSTGINPVRWLPRSPIVVDEAALPAPEATAALCRAAARAFGALTLPVAALPGSEIGLRLLRALDLPRPWRVVAPAYRTHGVALLGATAIAAADIGDVRDGTLLLANPNNPDGRLVARADLLAMAQGLGANGGMLVIDEAFADAAPDASILPGLSPEHRVVTFRSFGKFFGLAGVRLGFACGHAPTVAAIADLLGSWPVSATAIVLGTEAYLDDDWIVSTRAALAERAEAFDRVLSSHGLVVHGRCPLFRLATSPDASKLFRRLCQAGILVRPFDDAADWLRFGVPADEAARQRVDRALRDG